MYTQYRLLATHKNCPTFYLGQKKTVLKYWFFMKDKHNLYLANSLQLTSQVKILQR